jgi:hypothetical protein
VKNEKLTGSIDARRLDETRIDDALRVLAQEEDGIRARDRGQNEDQPGVVEVERQGKLEESHQHDRRRQHDNAQDETEEQALAPKAIHGKPVGGQRREIRREKG